MTDTNNTAEHNSGLDCSQSLQQQVIQAAKDKTQLNIIGGNSKSFLGTINDAAALDVSPHSGIISYEPTELVITARAGTTLKDINATLEKHHQALAFDPPAFAENATLGGTIACALAGPAKPYLGGARDYILGCKVLNGRGQIMQFGGEVMKNVAGYDVSRLMTGAMGTLGILLDISVKVLPKPDKDITLAATTPVSQAIEDMQALAGLGLPVTASAYIDGIMYTRLSGTDTAITAAANKLAGDKTDNTQLWQKLREHQHLFFENQQHDKQQLWRISVPPLTPELPVTGERLYDWAGMQRWLISDVAADEVRNACDTVGGHATLYRADESTKKAAGVFHPLPTPLLTLHQRLKREFDPDGIFNHQRLYPEF